MISLESGKNRRIFTAVCSQARRDRPSLFLLSSRMVSHSRMSHGWLMCFAVLLGALWVSPLPASGIKWVNFSGREYASANDVKNYFKFTSLSTKGGRIVMTSPKVRLSARSGSRMLYLNNVKFTMSFPVSGSKGKYYFSRTDLAKLVHPVLKPGNIKTARPFNTVVLDAGHGGHDSGARSRYGHEKRYNLALAIKLKRRLQAQGFNVRFTRSTDKFLSLGQRVAVANKIPNAIFVSLHFNSGGSSASGIETFALSPPGSSSTMGGYSSSTFAGNRRDAENIALATAVQAYSIKRLGAVDRGIKRARFKVLKGLRMPGILYEGGFLTSPSESRKIHSNTYLEKMAAADHGRCGEIPQSHHALTLTGVPEFARQAAVFACRCFA